MPQPKTMRAVAIGEDKTPNSLYLQEVACPAAGPHEILVKVMAAGVNRGDCYQRQGFYPPPPGAPTIMGLEFSGEVIACGDHVSKWKAGDRIAALVAGGGYAEYACVHEDHALSIPTSMSFTDAASLPETIFTVWANVKEAGHLQSGQSLLVHGGSSGIGTTAIQMAKLWGARVLVTAGTDDKCRACIDLGADVAINYNDVDFVTLVKQATDDKGVDVILDMVGGAYVDKNIMCAARGGRIINIAFLQGSRVSIDLMPVMLRGLTLTGSTLRARSIEEKSRLTKAIAKSIWPAIGNQIQPVIDTVFPLSEAGKAHARMESSAHIGKIILSCSD